MVLKIKHENLYHSHKIKEEEEEATKKEVDLINQAYNVITTKNGHFESECKKKWVDQNRGRANVSNVEEGTHSMFLSCLAAEDNNKEDTWLLDNTYNNHMIGNRDLFTRFDEKMKTKIKLGDDHLVHALGRDTVTIVNKKNEKKDIHNVYYVENLKHNLLGVGQMSENGFEVSFKGPTCIILDKFPSKMVIARVQMTRNRLYPLNLRSVKQPIGYAQYITNFDETCLWHLRYGHITFNNLDMLQKRSMVIGLPVIDVYNKPCESCIIAKHKRCAFPNDTSYRAQYLLGLVHTDLCGPMKIHSIGGIYYF